MTLGISRRQIIFGAAIFSATAYLLAGRAVANAYPMKPIRLLVGGAAGSVPDVLARLLGERLSTALGQPIVIENRPGAGGILAMQGLTASPADGYTLAIATMSQAVFNSYLFSKLTYDPLTDLEPISPLVTGGMAVAANPAFPANDLGQLIQLASRDPGKILVGIPSNGSPPHVIAELLVHTAGIEVAFVPFRSGPDAVGSVLPLIIAPHVIDGTLKGLVVTGGSREETLPGVRTVAEAGFAGAEGEAWIGLVAPAHTPRDVVMKLNLEIAAILATPTLRERLRELSFAPMTSTPEEFRALLRREHTRWGAVIRGAGIKLD
jgi:tripartite-type tricarboxylate transporter receptor subunit TctC